MKTTSLFKLLVIAIIVPMLAVGCDFIKSKMGSTSEESEKTEKTEDAEKTEEKPAPTISGVYDLDKDNTFALIGEEPFDDPDITDYNLKAQFNFAQEDSLGIRLVCRLNIFSADINNTIILKFLIKCNGTWEFDKESKKLSLNVVETSIEDTELKFDHEDQYTKKLRNYYGSDAALTREIKKQIKVDELAKSATSIQTVKDITEDGFSMDSNGKTIQFVKAK